ncbi:putative aldouronate transport system substrate-binding protein [Paenibacillus taihuensis]|uniref:Putative aldouronate transport system substrate-binding protein n=1 Tax=Paenibacillus taihuensis TaxID=1156355 RepID=A0A3D9QWI9_9BACL|nr:extracellular solute-binding protein [Paenibacillus taihuensis]REE69731.1 putative aldouronate transport system substrate-binding protein [Paenibacillus taihuensis]
MKKSFSILRVLVLITLISTVILSACSKSNDGNTSSSNNSDANATANQASAPEELKLKVVIPHFGGDPTGTVVEQQYEKEIEAYMGTKVSIEWTRIPWGEYREKTQIMLTSGDIPDVMLVLGNDNIVKYGEQGLFLDLNKYAENTPNYSTFVDATDNKEQYLMTDNDQLFAFYDGYSNPSDIEPSQYAAAYRLDVFEKNNIKVPTTQEEMYEAAKKLKALYPDSYPIGQSEQYMGYDGILNANHTSSGIYWNGTQYVYGPTEDAYKEGLMFLNKLYSEKLIDPAFWSDEIDQAKPKATSGKTFIYPQLWSGYVADFNANKEAGVTWTLAMTADNPTYGKAWKYGSDPKGKGLQNGYGIVISAKTKHPEQVVKLLDYQYSDKMIDLLMWGIEGKSYEVKDGQKQYLPALKSAPDFVDQLAKMGVSASMSTRPGIVFTPQERIAVYTSVPDVLFYHDGKAQLENYYIASNEYGGSESISPNDRAPKVMLSKDETDEVADTMTPIDTYVQESAVKFIKGEMGFDQWDNYLATIKKMGDLQAILDLQNSKVKK